MADEPPVRARGAPPPARRGGADAPSRSAQRDVDRAGRPSSTTPSTRIAEENDTWVVVLTGSGRAFSLGPRPEGPRDRPEHRRPPGRSDRPAGHAALLAAGAAAAAHAPAGDRGGQRAGLRRRHVPGARSRPAVRGRVGHLQQHRHRERAHLHRARARPGCSPGSSAWPGRTTCSSPGGSSTPPRRWRWGWCRGCCPTTSCSTPASTWPSRWRATAPTASPMTKDVLWANLEVAQPRGRGRARGPQPADARVHREPARGDPRLRRRPAARSYTDEPRRGMFPE